VWQIVQGHTNQQPKGKGQKKTNKNLQNATQKD
jgi:hypothetical protein